MNTPEPGPTPLRIEKSVYGGDGLAHTPAGEATFLPFTLPGELVHALPAPWHLAPAQTAQAGPAALLHLLEPSPDRVEPRCIHFGVCGGCHYQMASYPAQVTIKEGILRETFDRAGLTVLAAPGTGPDPVPLQSWPSPDAWGYRNRIRLRVRRVQGELRLGYNVRASNDFLPVTMCPISAPLLWRAAQAIMSAASGTNREVFRWLEAATDVELFCDGEQQRLQITLLCTRRPPFRHDSFEAGMQAFRGLCPELAGAGAVRVDPHSNRTVEVIAQWGTAGLLYRVDEEEYWITRGAFFQVNRFLVPTLVDLVCGTRTGTLAWDLFAGVGLFSRVLAQRFSAVTAVEANPTAIADLRRALARLGPQHKAVQVTAADFLKQAVLQRERPGLVVLDPPRAGAGEEVCQLLARVAAPEIAYLSCDPTTLARDLAVLTKWGYQVTAVHLIDLFPQTYHLETLVVLRRTDVGH